MKVSFDQMEKLFISYLNKNDNIHKRSEVQRTLSHATKSGLWCFFVFYIAPNCIRNHHS